MQFGDTAECNSALRCWCFSRLTTYDKSQTRFLHLLHTQHGQVCKLVGEGM